MSNISGAVFDFDHIASMINYISDIAKEEYGIELTLEARKSIVETVLSQYYDHVNAYSITVTGSDPYKFLSWAGIVIYQELYQQEREIAIKFLSASIAALNRSLLESGKFLPDWYLKKIIKMVINEFDNNEHIGLGANGLYMAFKGASLVESTL